MRAAPRAVLTRLTLGLTAIPSYLPSLNAGGFFSNQRRVLSSVLSPKYEVFRGQDTSSPSQRCNFGGLTRSNGLKLPGDQLVETRWRGIILTVARG
jgi:hypothetical protein